MERKEDTSEEEVVDDYPRALVQFLRRDGLGALQQRYAITATHHKRYPNLVCLKYNQVCPTSKTALLHHFIIPTTSGSLCVAGADKVANDVPYRARMQRSYSGRG